MNSEAWNRVLTWLTSKGVDDSALEATGAAVVIMSNIVWYIILFVLWNILQKFNKFVFKKIMQKKGKTLHLEFLQRVFSFSYTVLCFVLALGYDNIRNSLFGSATVIAAIVGFAGQDVIKDTLGGLQISLYRPFDIGDRVELEDGSAGIVESITMRHIVIKKIDTVRIVIPNSKANTMSLLNYSYKDVPRSFQLKFPIGYTSDVKKAKRLIESIIRNCELCVPEMTDAHGKKCYAPVYFLELADSAIILATTIYYNSKTPTEKVKDAVNSGIFEEFVKNGIEIPYNYLNVAMQNTGRLNMEKELC